MQDRPVIRVMVAEGHALFRAALRAGIGAEPDLEVVAEAGRSDQAIEEVRRQAPDVAVLSAVAPADAIQVCAAIKAEGVGTKVLVVSELPDQTILLGAVEAGADGYLDSGRGLASLLAAIRQVHAGEACIPPGMLGVLLRCLIHRRRDEDAAVDRFSRLSRREKEVFGLLVEGKDNRAIAEALVVSPHTARTHIQNVLEKLEVHSRLEAATLAMEYNLLERFAVKSS
jgi:DNA-binding NarL/FixJ family response regulator